jgi:hypothetical protein
LSTEEIQAGKITSKKILANGKINIDVNLSKREFITVFNNFSQEFEKNLIKNINKEVYLMGSNLLEDGTHLEKILTLKRKTECD